MKDKTKKKVRVKPLGSEVEETEIARLAAVNNREAAELRAHRLLSELSSRCYTDKETVTIAPGTFSMTMKIDKKCLHELSEVNMNARQLGTAAGLIEGYRLGVIHADHLAAVKNAKTSKAKQLDPVLVTLLRNPDLSGPGVIAQLDADEIRLCGSYETRAAMIFGAAAATGKFWSEAYAHEKFRGDFESRLHRIRPRAADIRKAQLWADALHEMKGLTRKTQARERARGTYQAPLKRAKTARGWAKFWNTRLGFLFEKRELIVDPELDLSATKYLCNATFRPKMV